MEKNAARKNRLKLLWQLVYIVGTLLLIYFIGFSNPEFVGLFSGQLHIELPWLLLCGAAMLAFWLIQACVFAYAGKMAGARLSFWGNIRITLFGEYYSAVTPFASGGQPMQIGYYRRYGVSAAKASSVLAVRYIGFISSICICFGVALVIFGGRIYTDYPVIFWLTMFGFLVNFLSIILVVFALLRVSLVRRIGLWVIRLITRFRPLAGRKEKWAASYLHGIDDFRAAGMCICKYPLRCIALMLLSLASVCALFSVSYLVYRALGLTACGFIELFSMQIFLFLAVAFVPTPGATGANEGGFYLFFSMVFPTSLLYSGMVLWRLFTYYSNLIIGAIFIIGDEITAMIKRRRSLPRGSNGQDMPESGISGGENSANSDTER